jgi:hypothetical protein
LPHVRGEKLKKKKRQKFCQKIGYGGTEMARRMNRGGIGYKTRKGVQN